MTRHQAVTSIAAIVVGGAVLFSIAASPAFVRWRECTMLQATDTLGYAGSGLVRLVTGHGADGLVSAADEASHQWRLMRCN